MKPTIKTAADIRPAMEYLYGLPNNNKGTVPTSGRFLDLEKIMRAIWEKTGAVPVGYIDGSNGYGMYVFGWGDEPAGTLTKVHSETKDKLTVFKFAISTPHIKKEIGKPMTILSGDADSMVRIIKAHGNKFIQPVSNTDMYPTAYPFISKTIKDLYLGGSPVYMPTPDTTARYQIYKHLTGEVHDRAEMDKWIKECTEKITRDTEADRKSRLITDGFTKKSLVIHEAPYYCDNPIHVAEVSFVGNVPVVLSERRVSSMDDLTDYPHVIGVNNLCKLNNGAGVLECLIPDASNTYSRTFNLFVQHFDSKEVKAKKTKDCLFTEVRHVIFPAEFVELNEAPATQPQASESSLSVLEF
jgi:hypothetical protein